jgi:hypothetical protein
VALVALASMLQGCMTMRVGDPTSLADGKTHTVRVTLADQDPHLLYLATVVNDSVIGYQHVPRGTPFLVGIPLGEVQTFEVREVDRPRTAVVVVVASAVLVYRILLSSLESSSPPLSGIRL